MTTTTDSPAAAADVAGPRPADMVDVAVLTCHPGNVREDLDLNAAFCASIAELGVRIPLKITPDGEGYRVIEGHRRLAAAVKAGLPAVPCVLDAEAAGDEAAQYLDMAIANDPTQRRNFSQLEEAQALFAAHEAGASRTRIRKATGRRADEVKAALAAGGIPPVTREMAGELAHQMSLTDLALLAEFEDDTEAAGRLLQALHCGDNPEYVAERIRQDRAELAAHEQLCGELEAAGYAITEDLPDTARLVGALAHDGAELTPEAHATCPGRGVFFRNYSLTRPVHYCLNPEANGHSALFGDLPSSRTTTVIGAGLPGAPGPAGGPARDDDGGPDRRAVIEGNKAWTAAAEVRKRWLREFLARRTAPRELLPWVTRQLLAMPQPLRDGLAHVAARPMFATLTGDDSQHAQEATGTCQTGRLPLLAFAAVAAAYEGEIHDDDAGRRATWRTDKYAPCPRRDAGSYLAFLASLGYQLAPIEQALADGAPYTGDHPADPLTAAEPDGAGTPAGPDGPAETGEPEAAEPPA